MRGEKQMKCRALPRAGKELGAVLLMTLLVMSLMAVLAVSLMDDVRYALRRTANVQLYAQADWYLSGAEDYAQSYLTALLAQTESPTINTALRRPEPIILPLETGSITVEISGGSQCLSLGALSENEGRKLFRQLLEVNGWPSLSAANFTSTAADWVDADSQPLPGGAEDGSYIGKSPAYRTANSAMASVSELRALQGMTEEKFQTLRPFVCAREDADSKLNINTLDRRHAPLLAAFMGGAPFLETARNLIEQRPAGGYEDLSALRAAPSLTRGNSDNADLSHIVFAPQHIWSQIRVDLQNISRHAIVEFEIKDAGLTPVFRRLGQEENRPRPAAKDRS
jgi:general secretion pathway protein K